VYKTRSAAGRAFEKWIKSKSKKDLTEWLDSEEGRGVRDGTGPDKESYRRKVEKKKKGRRQEKGEVCPVK
jgi:hypothetical protein